MGFRHFLVYLFTHYPKRMPLLLLILTLSGLLESVGIGAVIPVLEFFFQDKTFVASSPVSEFFYTLLGFLNITVSLPSLFSLIIAIFCLKSALAFTQAWFLEGILRYLYTTKLNTLFESMLHVDWVYSQNKKQGDLLTLFSQELEQFKNCVRTSITVLTETALFLFYLALSCFISLPLTLIILALLSLSYIPIRYLNAHIHSLSKHSIQARQTLTASIQESISGLKWIKASGLEKHSITTTQTHADHNANYAYKTGITHCILPSFFILFSIISLSAIAYLALVTFHLQFSYFLLITLIFYRLYPKFQGLQNAYQGMLQNLPSTHALDQALSDFKNHTPQAGSLDCPSVAHPLHFNTVTYAYSQDNHFKIKDLSLTISPNSFTGLVGPSGCGKTTVVDLLTSLIQPQSGSISLNDIPLSDYNLSHYRSHIGIVTQDTFLFHASLRDNLLWGHDPLDDAALMHACQQAHIDTFINSLPQGLDTLIGDRGIKLSGGQRQRVALARTLLRKPQLLILDEATSALDADSEHAIQQSINELKGKLTLLVISHRLSTVKMADRIVVMDNGAIIQEGTWDTLSQNEGLFQRFKGLQIIG